MLWRGKLRPRLAQGQRLESDEPGLDSLTQASRHLCAGFSPSLFPLKAGQSSRLVGPYLLQGPSPGVCSPRGPALLEGAPTPTPPSARLAQKQLDWCQPGHPCTAHRILGVGRCVGGSLLCDPEQASCPFWSQRGFLNLHPPR